MHVGEEVRLVGRDMFHFGEVETLVAILSEEEAQATYYDREQTHIVRLRLFEDPILLSGTDTSIVVATVLSDEALANAQAQGDGFEIDDGLREYAFRAVDLKPLRESNVPFWARYVERRCVHKTNGNARRRSHRACNLWRTHKEALSVQTAHGCHPLNLFFSANERSFAKSTRLQLEGYVALCRAANKDLREVQDIIYHMLFENREVCLIGDLIPVCTCSLN